MEKTEKQSRNWADIPRDIKMIIFSKLEVFDILCNVSYVCISWLKFVKAEERRLLQSVHFPVTQSGVLEEIVLGEDWCTDNLLLYVVHKSRTDSVKILRLPNCGRISERGLVEACKKLPVLRELALTDIGFMSENVFKEIGGACPKLYRLRIRHRGGEGEGSCLDFDKLAGKYIPQCYVIHEHIL
ncbi:hypothetical protein ACHQM5_019609 [Ranunculus cassubicifolius]